MSIPEPTAKDLTRDGEAYYIPDIEKVAENKASPNTVEWDTVEWAKHRNSWIRLREHERKRADAAERERDELRKRLAGLLEKSREAIAWDQTVREEYQDLLVELSREIELIHGTQPGTPGEG